MLASKRILRNYDKLLNLLRFSLKNADNPEFRDFDLVRNYLHLLKNLERNIKILFNLEFEHKGANYDTLLRSIFHDDLLEYKDYINNEEKEELVRSFKLLIELTNFTIDREGEGEVNIIDKELQELICLLSPLLEKI